MRDWIKSFLANASRRSPSSRVTFDDKSEILIRIKFYDLFALITGFRSALHCRAGIPDAIFDMFIRSAWICLWKANELRDQVSRGELERKSDVRQWLLTRFRDRLSRENILDRSRFSFELFVTSSTPLLPKIEGRQPKEVFIWLMINWLVTFPWAWGNCLLICQTITTRKWVICFDVSARLMMQLFVSN